MFNKRNGLHVAVILYTNELIGKSTTITCKYFIFYIFHPVLLKSSDNEQILYFLCPFMFVPSPFSSRVNLDCSLILSK